MGFRGAVLLGLVLLSSTVASQTRFNLSTDETLSQIPQEQVTAVRSAPTTAHQSNHTEPPIGYHLRSLAVGTQTPARQTLQNLQRPEATGLTSEQLQLIRGPDLNPPVKQESKVLVKVEQRVPVPADSVAARCGEGGVTVEVKQNFLGNGQLIHPSDLTLGGCAALDTADHILHFQSELQGCGSTLRMTDEALIYSFTLTYSPTPIGSTFILKTNPAEVVIECHYRRRRYVSSHALTPTWIQFASDTRAEQRLHFSLRLMTEDWQSQRPSSVYFLSDTMHIEASVLQGHHVPLRVFVDSCVATTNPDPRSQPRYPFINNHGCLTDAKLTGAKSYFMQRSQEDKLHFLLKAFKFHRDHTNSIFFCFLLEPSGNRRKLYITCHLKATTVSVPIDSRHKVCSFLTEAKRWVASGGDNQVCSCCESSCAEQRRRRSFAADADLRPDVEWEGTAALGPILLLDEPAEASEPASPLGEVIQAASSPSVALLCGAGAALAVVLLVFMGAVTCGRLRKPTGHTVCT